MLRRFAAATSVVSRVRCARARKSQSKLHLLASWLSLHTVFSREAIPLCRAVRPVQPQPSRFAAMPTRYNGRPDSSAPPAFRPLSRARRKEVVGCFPFPPAGGHQRQVLLGHAYRGPSSEYEPGMIAFVSRPTLASVFHNGSILLGYRPPT